MRFALLSYGDEDAPAPDTWAPAAEGPAVRLLPSSTSLTWRSGRAIDGPVVPGRLQLLGVELADCEDLNAALALAAGVADGDPRVRRVELRPLAAR